VANEPAAATGGGGETALGTREEAALLERWRRVSGTSTDARSIADAIGATLTSAIVERELPPGFRLREERLASLFNVSRTPIREALAGLASASLAGRDTRGSLRVGAITSEQILDVYAVRRCLEGLSAALAAEAATGRVVARLRELNRACERAAAAEDYAAFTHANNEFHKALAESTGNELLIRFVADLQNWVKRFPTTTLSYPGRQQTALAEHDRIVDAIEVRDAELAERLARDHMRVAEEIRLRMLLEDSTAGTTGA
jgi:DNA-binding GntR family transcriptional regulator